MSPGLFLIWAIAGLPVEGFRALRRVDWPTDGNGWGETVPDMVMVGGVNGSGKTTLLELIAEAAQAIFVAGYKPTMKVPVTAAVDMELDRPGGFGAVLEWPHRNARSRKTALPPQEPLN